MIITRMETQHGRLVAPWKLRTCLVGKAELNPVLGKESAIDEEAYIRHKLRRQVADQLVNFLAEGSPEPLMFRIENESIPEKFPVGKTYITRLCVYEPDNESRWMRHQPLEIPHV